MAIPLAYLALAGAGGASWASKNVLGTSDWLRNQFDPNIKTTPTTPISSDISSFTARLYDFRVQVLAPSDGDIKALDDFFEAYGYNVQKFETPNLNVRTNFTFVKTRDAVVYSTNRLAAEQMAAMLNSGTKFWRNKIS